MIKQVYDLTENDLRTHATWVLLSEDDEDAIDEATAKSTEENPDNIETIFITRTSFILRDGSKYSGYVYSEPTANICFLQPTLVISSHQFYFWSGIRPQKGEIVQFYKILDKDEKDIFPITWIIDDNIKNIQTTGIIQGFSYFDSLKPKTIKTITQEDQ